MKLKTIPFGPTVVKAEENKKAPRKITMGRSVLRVNGVIVSEHSSFYVNGTDVVVTREPKNKE